MSLHPFCSESLAVFQGIPDALLITDLASNVLWGNRAAAARLACPPEELLKGRCFELWHQRAAPCDNCPALRCVKSGEKEEQWVTDPLGRTFKVKSFPLRDPDGTIRRVATVSIDRTEQVQLREEAIRQDRLAALGELAAGVAHEINNPNALILLNAPILAEICQDLLPVLDRLQAVDGDFTLGRLPYSRLRQELPRLHREILESAHRIRRIVEDLKGFVREKETPPEGIDLNEAVDAALRLVSSAIKKATGHFTAIFGKRMPPTRGDLQRLEQVAVNLLVNACQALPDRACSITMRTWYDETRRVNILEVVDQGVGIPAEHLPRLFEPFFTTRQQSGGTGLGLSVSRNILQEYGGTIVVESEPGQGTTVRVALPALTAERAE